MLQPYSQSSEVVAKLENSSNYSMFSTTTCCIFFIHGQIMKIFYNLVIVILVLLAISSGVTKVLLMPQDVEFFAEFGFTTPILIIFGAFQLLGGVLLVIRRARIIGSVIVALTFLISAVLLIVMGNLIVAVITLFCVALLGLVIQQSLSRGPVRSNAVNI